MNILLLVIIVVSALLFLVLMSTIKGNGNLGINTGEPICPKCKEKPKAFRSPKSIRQALWGGWTCPGCNSEMDKWGKEI